MTRAWRYAFVTIAFVSVITAHAEPPAGYPTPNATVEQPRAFGYVVGDVLSQRVLLRLDGLAFEPAALPATGRLGAWFERRSSRIETSQDGSRSLVVEYQVINAPPALTTVSLPAWSVQPKSPGAPLRIGAWPISVAPLTLRDGLPELQPDRAAPAISTDPIERHALLWSAACAFTVVVWLSWLLLRAWRSRVTQPFAQALRELRRLDDGAPEAWFALHRAFDRTAGRAMQPATLNVLFQRAPHLAPLRAQIERFFGQSSARFFGSEAPADPLVPRKLCAELCRLERRHEQ